MPLNPILEARARLTKAERKAFARQVNRLIVGTAKADRQTVDASVALLKRVKQDLVNRMLGLPKGNFTRATAEQLKREAERRLGEYERLARNEFDLGLKRSARLAKQYSDEVIKAQGARAPTLGIAPQLIDNVATRSADLVTSVATLQRAKLNDILNLGVLSGKSSFEITKQLSDSFDLSLGRAEAIARTELHGIHGQVQVAQLDELATEVPGLRKQWVAVLDERTRLGHEHAHLQSVPHDEPFLVHRTVRGKDGEYYLGDLIELMYPGDVAADEPGETINCRCTMVPDFSAVTLEEPLNRGELGPIIAPLRGLGAEVSRDLRKVL